MVWCAALVVLGGIMVCFWLLCRLEKKDIEIKRLKRAVELNEAYIRMMTEEALEVVENRKLADKVMILTKENMELLRLLAEKR